MQPDFIHHKRTSSNPSSKSLTLLRRANARLQVSMNGGSLIKSNWNGKRQNVEPLKHLRIARKSFFASSMLGRSQGALNTSLQRPRVRSPISPITRKQGWWSVSDLGASSLATLRRLITLSAGDRPLSDCAHPTPLSRRKRKTRERSSRACFGVRLNGGIEVPVHRDDSNRP